MSARPMSFSAKSLIGPLLDSICDDAAFADLPRLMSISLGSATAQFQIHGPNGAQQQATYGISPEILKLYEAYYWRHDAWAIGYQSFNLKTVEASDNFIASDAFRNSEIYNDLLRRNGDLFRCLGFVTDLDDGERMLFGVHRTSKQPTFESELVEATQVLQPLLTHIVQARRRAVRSVGGIVEHLLDAELDAIIVVASDGSIRYANSSAKALIGGGLFNVVERRLVLNRAAEAREFRHAISWACSRRGGRTLRFTTPTAEYAVEIDALPGNDAHLARVKIRDGESYLSRQIQAAGTTYGLTLAERALAAGLMRGNSLTEHTEKQGVRITTVRSQLRSLLGKVGVGRQAQLILAIQSTEAR